ncbi:meiosis-specific coiled-coil domain-containing protein MEIOC [Protopterus annectens]|uniref:meiosis-specific coiled-coil domain-containing protein MEIOC n=1 Tax=Protopterus annectens TaxID=7888 RepID=UPI001CFC3252|nr:meiosis-specific coiled-coil domain-containing protein MEIOC [Protopterus annectens]
MEPHQSFNSSLMSASDYSSSVDASVFYGPWSTLGDGYKQLCGSQLYAKNRIHSERNDYGSETDLYRLVSSILEESDKSQFFSTDGSFSSNLKSMCPPGGTKAAEQHDLLTDTQGPSDLSSAQQMCDNDCLAAAKQYLHSSATASEQRTDEFYNNFNTLDLKEEQFFLPLENDTMNYYAGHTCDSSRVAFHDAVCVKNGLLSQLVLPETVEKLGVDMYSYTRDKLCTKQNDIPLNCKRAEIFPSYFSRHVDSSECGRSPEYSKSFHFSKNSAFVEDKLYSKESALPGDGLKTASECGIKPHPICQINDDYSDTLGNQMFSGCNPQHLDYFKHVNFLTNRETDHSRPLWSDVQTEASSSVSYRNQGNITKFNSHLSSVSKMSPQASEFSQLSSLQLAQNNKSCFQVYNQDNNSRFSSLETGYGTEKSHCSSQKEGVNKPREEHLYEIGCDKKMKQLNVLCENYSSQQYICPENICKRGFSVKPQNGHFEPEDGQNHVDVFSQNVSHDILETQAYYTGVQKQGSGCNVNNHGNCPQTVYLSNNYMMRDLKCNHDFLQLDSNIFPSRATVPPRHSVVPRMEPSDSLFHDDLSHLNPYFNDMKYGNNPLTGFMAAFGFHRPSRIRNGPSSELSFQLEECNDQWKALEKERKKAELVLAKTYPGKRVSSASSIPVPRLPSNPSRVDRLVVDQLREQTRVVALLGKMEYLRSFPLHANISTALAKHLEAIHVVQTRRREEIINTSRCQRQGLPRRKDDRDVFALASAVKELSAVTRKARTALWCALQMTLPKTTTITTEGHTDASSSLQDTLNPEEQSYICMSICESFDDKGERKHN